MKRSILSILNPVVLVLVMVAAACMTRPLVQVDPQTESYVKEEMTQVQFSGVDILVMVDNSRSMTEEQANLASNFPTLITSLLNPPIDPVTGKPEHVPVKDLHIGVVSSDMGTGGYTVETCADPIDGDDGILKHTPNPAIAGCDSTYPTYLAYDYAEPDIAAINWMATGFGCIATLGSGGCGFEQQLKSVRRALVDHTVPGGPNAGFLRPDSILTILWVTDEEDCSVADPAIFDTANPALGHLNLRCYLHPYMVQPIDDYINAFRALRPPEKLVLGFIVGVPAEPACQGFGDAIPDCLLHPMMQEEVDGIDPTRLRYSCSSATGNAFPPRRMVTIAQAFGANALVQSICTSDFSPAIAGLTAKLHEVVDSVGVARELATSKDPLDPCRCMATCTILEQLVDNRPCPPEKPCYEQGGPGTGCTLQEDEGGMLHSMCVIPQAGTRITTDCNLECNDAAANHQIDGVGWYYVGRDWTFGGTPQVDPMINFTDGMTPAEGSNVYIQCESEVCPQSRECGNPDNPSAICCGEEEFCNCDPNLGTCGLSFCMPRPR